MTQENGQLPPFEPPTRPRPENASARLERRGVVPLVGRFLQRILRIRTYRPYERLLGELASRPDIWIASQGEYLAWWRARETATFRVVAADGACRVETSLDNAVIEKYPGEFLEEPETPCPAARGQGEVWVTIDETLERKDILSEVLRREGILNFRFGSAGEAFLRRDKLEAVLEALEAKLQGKNANLDDDDVAVIRQAVADALGDLPLLRLWYHPLRKGVVTRAVFSPRYDVDRAITNLARIRRLEQRYGASSTLYVRAYCPFYSQRAIRKLAARPWCSEIGLHAEFVRTAAEFGDEFQAAVAEKAQLEKLTGRVVRGVCLHGGEGLGDRKSTAVTFQAMNDAGIEYDTSGTVRSKLPFRSLFDGKMSSMFRLSHAYCDIYVKDSPADFYYGAMYTMHDIYEKNGVFVLQMHPMYFGFLRYLFNPVNWPPLARFLWGILRRSLARRKST